SRFFLFIFCLPSFQLFPLLQVEGEVEIVGIVRNSEKRAPFGAKNDPNSRFYHYRDVDNMARFCGTAPVFLDATDESSVPGGPIGGQTKVSLRNEHFSYILTWYSLSALTSFMWYRRFVRGLPLM
ncbi:surfeit locus protein 1-like, partial [Limulus polyphemus]|uniref:SURF1-like protein n=1 Tax=Limulus polyphemus TaxID=6850 RepID=A0ABM1TIT2_LIMPO